MLSILNSTKTVDELNARIAFLEKRDVVLYHQITPIERDTLITLGDNISNYEELTFEVQMFESGAPTITTTQTFKVDLLLSGTYSLLGLNRTPVGIESRVYVNRTVETVNTLRISRDVSGSSEKVNLVRITGKKKLK